MNQVQEPETVQTDAADCIRGVFQDSYPRVLLVSGTRNNMWICCAKGSCFGNPNRKHLDDMKPHGTKLCVLSESCVHPCMRLTECASFGNPKLKQMVVQLTSLIYPRERHFSGLQLG